MAKTTKTAAPPVTPQVPVSTLPSFEQDAGAGFENVRADDLSIPFLMILQKGSPEVDVGHPQYALKGIKGAMQGHVMNTLTKEIYNPDGEKIAFVPCFYQKMYVEWQPREKGGGIVQSFADPGVLNHCHKNEKGQDVLPSGNIIVTTAYFFGFMVRDDERVRCVISLTSTQLKKARQWLSIATAIRMDGTNGKYNPPLFSHQYLLSTIPESNAKGNWMGWKIELAGVVTDQLLIGAAREVVIQSKANQLRLAPPPVEVVDDPIETR